MQIKAFHVKDGDCLLLRGDDDTVLLVDGGRAEAFENNVLPTLAALDTDIDLAYLSHIDNDHISGFLRLIDTEIKWRVFDFHQGDADFAGAQPNLPRPRRVREIWHNGFTSLIDDQTGRIEDALVQVTQTLALSDEHRRLFDLYENLTTGVKDTLELNYRLELCGFDAIWNARSDRDDFLIALSDDLETYTVGGFEITILGPTIEALEALRKDWNAWLDKNDLDVPALRRQAEERAEDMGLSLERATLDLLLKEATRLGQDSDDVTEPNVASLTLLVDDGQHKVLLTGDARSEEILAGLRKHGLIDNNNGMHVDVLKVPHHGAAGNVTKELCEFITADHYVFCANGAHTNPEKVVLDGFLSHRIGDDKADNKSPKVGDPFEFWFTTHSSTPGITDNQKTFLKSVEKHLDDNWSDNPDKFERHYPDPAVDPFLLDIQL